MKKILLGLVAVIALFAIVVQTRPDTFHVERSSTIAAPPEAVFAAVNDFHRWPDWSPWEKLDPNMTRKLEGEPGVGQTYGWVGNDKAGEGRMRITGSVPSSQVDIALVFIRPFPDSCGVHFSFTPEAGGTKVVWQMDGRTNFVSKAMCMFKSMDSMMGPDFEKGLDGLARVALATPVPPDSAAAGAAGGKPTSH